MYHMHQLSGATNNNYSYSTICSGYQGDIEFYRATTGTACNRKCSLYTYIRKDKIIGQHIKKEHILLISIPT